MGLQHDLDASEIPSYWFEYADRGDAEAQWALADRYFFGNGTEIDYDKAREWYEKAADNGIEAAKIALMVLDEGSESMIEVYKRLIGENHW